MCSLLPYGTGICHYAFIYILYCVCPFLFYIFLLPGIDNLEWSTIPACPSLMCSFNRGNIEVTNSLEICVWCLCMFYVYEVIGFVDWLDYIWACDKRSWSKVDTLPQNQTSSKLFSVLPLESGMFQVTISIIKKWFWSKCVLYGIKTGVRSGVDVCNNGHSECHNNTEKNHLYAILMHLVHLSSC